MKKIYITVLETRTVEMEKEISDDFYNALYDEDYDQNDFDALEDECVDRMDSVEFEDSIIQEDAGIVDIIDEDNCDLYHFED